jgi:hypothetical protein
LADVPQTSLVKEVCCGIPRHYVSCTPVPYVVKGYCPGVNGVNRNTVPEVPSARFPKVAFLEGLADINLKEITLKATYNCVRILHGDNQVVPVD